MKNPCTISGRTSHLRLTAMPRLSKEDTALIERNFTNHRPDGDTQQAMEDFRKLVKAVAKSLHNLPPSRERSLALTNLEQTTMWTMAAMARDAYDETTNGD